MEGPQVPTKLTVLSSHGETAELSDTRREVADGLFYTHVRLSQNTNKTLENSAFLYGLIEVLGEKGIISTDELDQRKKIVAERLIAQWKAKGLGVMLQEVEEDKYTFDGEARSIVKTAPIFARPRVAVCALLFPSRTSKKE